MMKMWIAILAFGLLMLSMPFCSASITRDQLALGGITTGASEAYVQSIYGPPDERKELMGLFDLEYNYGGTFSICFDKDPTTGEYFVAQLETNVHNGIATPAGVEVGMTRETVRKVYGQPDINVYTKKPRDGLYNVDGQNGYGFWFFFDKAGKVKTILAGAHE